MRPVRVLNNTVVAAKGRPLNRVNGDYHDVFVSHNLFHGESKDIVPFESAVIADPLFKDKATGDFHLSSKSRAQNAGAAGEISPIQDLHGKARTIHTLGALV